MELTVAELFAGVGGFRVGLNKITKIDENGRAVEKNGYALQYVPNELRTPELCEMAIRDDFNALNLQFVPKKLRTPELCELAVKTAGDSLKWVPKELKSQELCEIAVTSSGWALCYVPEELKTRELTKLAIENLRSDDIEDFFKLILPKEFATEFSKEVDFNA